MQLRHRGLPSDRDSGAAAVEFALVMLPLFLVVFGIIEFGRFYNLQIEISGAARQAARTMAITNDATATKNAARAAAPLNPALTNAEITITGTCPAGSTADVTVTIRRQWTINLRVVPAVGPFNATGIGVLRCGG